MGMATTSVAASRVETRMQRRSVSGGRSGRLKVSRGGNTERTPSTQWAADARSAQLLRGSGPLSAGTSAAVSHRPGNPAETEPLSKQQHPAPRAVGLPLRSLSSHKGTVRFSGPLPENRQEWAPGPPRRGPARVVLGLSPAICGYRRQPHHTLSSWSQAPTVSVWRGPGERSSPNPDVYPFH